jgi:phosphatidylinositol alpha-1,6-mannosyltransferase
MSGMNLALITQDFPPEVGGIETYAKELAKRFYRQCNHFLVVAPDKPSAADVDGSLPYPVKRIKASNPFLGPKLFLDAPVIFRKHNIEHVFHTQWQTLPASVFSRQRGIVKKIFVAAHARELLFNPFSKVPGLKQWYEWYTRQMLAKVDLFFPVSEYTRNILIDHGVEPQRIITVINGTDPDTFFPVDTSTARKKIGISTEKVVLTITRLVSRKGVDTALRAFRNVLSDHPDSIFVVVGEGPERNALNNLAVELDIQESVRFVGRVSYQRLNYYYNACTFFVMPSKTDTPNVEGFGIVFLEANACAKPVIGTYSGGIPSAVIDGETGLLVEENNIDELAKAMNRLFLNSAEAKNMGQKGRERVLNEANWDVSAAKIYRRMEYKIKQNSTFKT